MADTFRISRELVDEMFAQARLEAPREACGMLGGTARHVKAAYPATNTDTNNVTYNIDPQEAFSIVRRMRGDGVEFIASYHSHPETEAYPSPTDRGKAGDTELIYVIFSLRSPENSEFRAFEIDKGEVTELTVQID